MDQTRCPWSLAADDLRAYHDTEWGVPIHDERGLFERIALESFQSGLSWATILRKREHFRAAFANFEVDAVAALTDDDVNRLLADASIIRNRAKIMATISNARVVHRLRESRGDDALAELLWSFAPETPLAATTNEERPAVTAESRAMARALKELGFRFVGPTTSYALMCAVGIDNGHLVSCFRRDCARL